MSKFEFDDIVVGIDKPHRKKKGVVVVGKKSYQTLNEEQKECIRILFERQDDELSNFFGNLQKYIEKLQVKNEELEKYKAENKILKQQLIKECKEHREFYETTNQTIKNLEKKAKNNIAINDSIYGMPYTYYYDLLMLGYKVVDGGVLNGRYVRVLEKD